MLLPTPGVYPDFTLETTIESLLLNMVRKMIKIQKNPANNPNELEKVELNFDESNLIASAAIELKAQISSITGAIEVIDPFTNVEFTAGTGSYPFNRLNLPDALVHLAFYQSQLEINPTNNPNTENRFIDFSILSTTNPALFPLDITIGLANYPIKSVATASGTVIEADPYLA